MKKFTLFIFIAIFISACTMYFVKFNLLEENKSGVILKEYPDSVGTIKTHVYQIYSIDGIYEKITIKPEQDFFNVGDTIK